MNRNKLEFFSHLVISAIGIAALIFLILKYLLVPTLPFIIAWGVAFALRPASVFISGKLHVSRKLVAVLLAIFAVAVGLGAVIGLSILGIRELWELLGRIAADERLPEILDKISDPLGSIFGGDGGAEIEAHLGEALGDALSALLSGLVSAVSSAVASVPKILFFILITVISAIYFSLDLENINSFVRARLPERISRFLVYAKGRFFSVGIRYIKAYFILMLITFVIILSGLLILRVKNAILLAALISLLDVLPIIGVGTVLVPWSIFNLAFGSVGLGVGLAVLLLVNEIVRQFAEPKIIGKHLGIHPVLSLVLLYVGYSLFGILGLILMPILGAFLGVLFKKKNSSEVS